MPYLDSNATTELLPEVLEAMLPWLREGYHNPSGTYRGAKAARKAIDHARGQVADLLGALPEEIVFTGCGTESINMALRSLDHLCGDGYLLTSAIEHSAVLRTGESFARGIKMTPVNELGRLDLAAFEQRLEGAAFASVMWANNETGIIQPVAEANALAHERGLPFHCDAVQGAGKIPIDVRETPVDLLSISAHKFHGPKGVGALYLRQGLRFTPLLTGGGHEGGRRSGTENTAGIVGMGAAAGHARRDMESATARIRAMRDDFEARVLASIPDAKVNGDRQHRLPNTCHISFARCEAAGLLILLDEADICCSAGSACMTGKQRPSHVQKAMGISDEQARSSLRISFSERNTPEDAVYAAAKLTAAVEKLRRVQGKGVGPVIVYPEGQTSNRKTK